MNITITLEDVRELLSMVPDVTVWRDMTGPVDVINNHPVEAVSRLLRFEDMTLEAFTKEFSGKSIALYEVKSCGVGWNAGDLITVVDENMQPKQVVAQASVQESFILRYGSVAQ